MFGKNPRVSPLETRKRLLVATSELNRAQLIAEWQTMAEGVHGLTDRARSFVTTASSVGSLLTGLVGFARDKPAPAAAKSSWLQKLISGARLASTIWLACRARGSDSEKT